jgi:hypothetical protein
MKWLERWLWTFKSGLIRSATVLNIFTIRKNYSALYDRVTKFACIILFVKIFVKFIFVEVRNWFYTKYCGGTSWNENPFFIFAKSENKRKFIHFSVNFVSRKFSFSRKFSQIFLFEGMQTNVVFAKSYAKSFHFHENFRFCQCFCKYFCVLEALRQKIIF